ncbi:MAG: hypothetical protein QOK17_466 [Sphingomonadales bacterium]|jgi:hypothetical protein|nr:hypothetical protein [Sphingomonadales bacterium]
MADSIKIAKKSNPASFKKALNRLATDERFRSVATAEPAKLTESFELSVRELHALRQAAILSGVDMTRINRVRLNEIERMQATSVSLAADWDIDISCCCCCCCGETGVVRAYA